MGKRGKREAKTQHMLSSNSSSSDEESTESETSEDSGRQTILSSAASNAILSFSTSSDSSWKKIKKKFFGTVIKTHWDKPVLPLTLISFALFVVTAICLAVLASKIVTLESTDSSEAIGVLSHRLRQTFTSKLKALNGREESKGVLTTAAMTNFTSCADIFHKNPSSSSGYYLIRSPDNILSSVYCGREKSCGNGTEGWRRLSKVDLDNCPTGFKTQLLGGYLKGCVVKDHEPSCTSVLFSSSHMKYFQICGKIEGYKVENLQSLHGGYNRKDSGLNGIILEASSKHIWSFTGSKCDCRRRLRFENEHYTCSHSECDVFASTCKELLWRDFKCGALRSWFHRIFTNSISTGIKLSVCQDGIKTKKHIPIAFLEFYVR